MLLKKRRKVLSLLAALVMTLSISSVALAAGFNTISGDGVFREYNFDAEPVVPTSSYEAEVEAAITKGNMLLNLDIDYIRGDNLIRYVSINDANLILISDPDSELISGKFKISSDGKDMSTILPAAQVTILTKNGISLPSYEYVYVSVINNRPLSSSNPLIKDGIMIMLANYNYVEDRYEPVLDGEGTPILLLLVAGKSTIQFSNQNAQGGQNQQ